MKSVMLTGATGFIGSHLAEKLVQQKVCIHLFVRRRNNLIDLLEKKGAKIYAAQPDNSDVLKASLHGADTVIHCAGAATALKEKDYIRANLRFTTNILNLLKKKQKFLFISSQAAAGPSHSQLPVDEKTEPGPLTYYGISKLMAEVNIREWGRKNNMTFTILRPSVVYGPGERNLYNYFKLINKGILFMLGSGKKKVSMIHIDDLISAIMTAAQSPFTGETYFVSNDEAYSWEEIGCSIKKALKKTFLLKVRIPEFTVWPVACFFDFLSLITKKPSLINSQKIIEMKQSAWLCSNRKIKERLHWKPGISLEKGIEQTADWYIRENWI